MLKIRGSVALFAASAMLFSSTGAIAATTSATTAKPSAWAVLSVMSGGAAAANVCGVAAAAAVAGAQPTGGCVLPQTDVPPVAQAPAEVPPAPLVAAPVAAGGVLGLSPLILGLVALAAGLGLFVAVRNNNGTSNSPA